ncbi:hypothetical protein MBLNU230_g1546t1 [Neophaeotheca triangularis]
MFDVIIVGAGLSGLQAAWSAKQAGLSTIVVEARNRVGGKVWSEPTLGGLGKADLGAAWVNTNHQPRIAAYLRQFGLETVEQRLTGTAVVQVKKGEREEFPFGITPNFTPDEKRNLEFIRDHIEAESQSPGPPKQEDDQVTLDQYVRKLGATAQTAQMVNIWSRVMHGVESTEQSAAWFIDYCRRNKGLLAIRKDDPDGGNYQRLFAGTQSIAEGVADLLGRENIRLGSPVASIANDKNHVTVTTNNGDVFSARKCIISMPSTMLKDLNFSPPLPQRLREVTNSTILGHYNKSILIYRKPWWREAGYNGFVMSFDSPVCLGRDTSIDDKGLYMLTCFVNGANGEAWSKLYPHQRRKSVIDQVAFLYGQGPDSEVYRPVEVFDQIWKHEKYSQGALAPIHALGHYTGYADVYGKPTGNVHFVGTEYSPEWKGYMEGALCSGEIGAGEVAESLRNNSARAKL